MLMHKQHVVLEAGIQMRLQSQLYHHGIVMTIDMRVDTIQPLEDLLDGCGEGFRERDANSGGEDGFIVNVRLHPRHQVFDVGWGGHLGGFGVAGRSVLPEVFEFVGGFHFGAGLGGAEFGDGTVEEVDLVVEVDNWGGVSVGKGMYEGCWTHH
jgi:hypothetical protein